ncbi:hypothetical protein DICPUDRAFT_82297 [Dictyostelium purpureum]|uniref:Transmembrane protein n=1 Tax=Dictyostelium purpureum TaxID=5786 RepID=F0ZW44_DICPU|nr:uncharacterized protein DICPUDRAFT_82297 [Dictyostelium purpureum]EGC31833.1 hypothetical protein DICPUDRAFT_82297 [Dictyostelium purpureum]|eukprot:XP_003291634.1 hypothetical protein DICPUDRAFT_82297 [Dictyostelium purpureum]
MTTGNQYPSSSSNNIASTSSRTRNSGQLRRSQTVFDIGTIARKFPWLPVWTLLINCITLGFSIVFICLFWKRECAVSLIFLFLYCFIFLINCFYGFVYFFKFTGTIELSKRNNNILLISLIIFICVSVVVFILTIFVKETGSCIYVKNRISVSILVLIRANSILDLIFLGGLLFFNIVLMCSYSANKRKRENQNQTVDLEKPIESNYHSKDSIGNYPLPPPPLYLMEQSVGPRGHTYSGLPPPPPPSSTHPQYINNNQELQSNINGLPPPPPYPGN